MRILFNDLQAIIAPTIWLSQYIWICYGDDKNQVYEFWNIHNRRQDRQDGCFTRSCDQIITGRNLMYGRALQIVQNEEYLNEADLNVIRRRKRRVKRQKAIVDNVSALKQNLSKLYDATGGVLALHPLMSL